MYDRVRPDTPLIPALMKQRQVDLIISTTEKRGKGEETPWSPLKPTLRKLPESYHHGTRRVALLEEAPQALRCAFFFPKGRSASKEPTLPHPVSS